MSLALNLEMSLRTLVSSSDNILKLDIGAKLSQVNFLTVGKI
jgi:hypothetical protein